MSRIRISLLIFAVVALRLAIGFHFYFEGTDKLKSGNFDATGFLATARGPLAPLFQGMQDDPSGSKILGTKTNDANNSAKVEIDPSLTFALWDDFVDRATAHYEFGDKDLLDQIQSRVERLDQELRSAMDPEQSERIAKQLTTDRAIAGVISRQRADAKGILDIHRSQFEAWIDEHRVDIESHINTAGRLQGFQRDGVNAASAALEVESLRKQVDQIRAERNSRLLSWKNEIVAFWDSLEREINGLAVDIQRSKSPITVHRPFDQPYSKIKWINSVIPWFDTVVGACLILGLLTRSAALAGAIFLLSIALSQPFWLPGSVPTYNQIVELTGLLVIAGIGAGRYGGLDYFIQGFWQRWRKGSKRNDSPQS